MLAGLGSLAPEARRETGARINDAKSRIAAAIEARVASAASGSAPAALDVTLPGRLRARGSAHPIAIVTEDFVGAFVAMGFERAEGTEAETDEFNFLALNTPADHPARDMQATYYLSEARLLRSHTSPIWARAVRERTPPFRLGGPGRCFRRDAADASHSPCFHQVEGALVDDRCSFADLKGVLDAFMKGFFGPDTATRFEPRYFPFTEPSAELLVRCVACRGAGCRMCARSGWLEIGGCGMIHPNILAHGSPGCRAAGVRGFAFGIGVERLAMLKYGLTDMRWLYDNDLRVLGRVQS